MIRRIENKSIATKYEQCALENNTIKTVFHSSHMKSIISITKEGFKLPKTNARKVLIMITTMLIVVTYLNKDGWGTLYFGKMIYFSQSVKGGIFYSRDALGYVILAEMKVIFRCLHTYILTSLIVGIFNDK